MRQTNLQSILLVPFFILQLYVAVSAPPYLQSENDEYKPMIHLQPTSAHLLNYPVNGSTSSEINIVNLSCAETSLLGTAIATVLNDEFKKDVIRRSPLARSVQLAAEAENTGGMFSGPMGLMNRWLSYMGWLKLQPPGNVVTLPEDSSIVIDAIGTFGQEIIKPLGPAGELGAQVIEAATGLIEWGGPEISIKQIMRDTGYLRVNNNDIGVLEATYNRRYKQATVIIKLADITGQNDGKYEYKNERLYIFIPFDRDLQNIKMVNGRYEYKIVLKSDPAVVGDDLATKVFNLASSQIGQIIGTGAFSGLVWADSKYTYCDRFVSAILTFALGKSLSERRGYETALQDYEAHKDSVNQGNPPKGTIVYYAGSQVNGGMGHVGIADGSKNLISVVNDTDGVKKAGLDQMSAPLLGWIYPSEYLAVHPTPAVTAVTLKLYAHEDSAGGPVIAGAQVIGQDEAGNSFSQTTNSSGYVTVTGTPGIWNITVSKNGYAANVWSQLTTKTETRQAYMLKNIIENSPSNEKSKVNVGVVTGRTLYDGAPVANMPVELYTQANRQLYRSIKTDSHGEFVLSNIPWGDYYVSLILTPYYSYMISDSNEFKLSSTSPSFNMDFLLLKKIHLLEPFDNRDNDPYPYIYPGQTLRIEWEPFPNAREYLVQLYLDEPNTWASSTTTLDNWMMVTAAIEPGKTYGCQLYAKSNNGYIAEYSFKLKTYASQVQPAQINYSLSVTSQGQGSVSLNPTGGSYASGTQVTLTANAASGWQFSGWSGGLSGSQNPATISMTSAKSITANFSQIAAVPLPSPLIGTTPSPSPDVNVPAGLILSKGVPFLSPFEAQQGQTVTIKVKATNNSNVQINYALPLELNGKMVATSQPILLQPATSQDIVFQITAIYPGNNDFRIGNLVGFFIVQ